MNEHLQPQKKKNRKKVKKYKIYRRNIVKNHKEKKNEPNLPLMHPDWHVSTLFYTDGDRFFLVT